jgi:hypothetical protein
VAAVFVLRPIAHVLATSWLIRSFRNATWSVKMVASIDARERDT